MKVADTTGGAFASTVAGSTQQHFGKRSRSTAVDPKFQTMTAGGDSRTKWGQTRQNFDIASPSSGTLDDGGDVSEVPTMPEIILY